MGRVFCELEDFLKIPEAILIIIFSVLKPFGEYHLLKGTYLSKACDKGNSDVITPTLHLKFSNGADTKSCVFE